MQPYARDTLITRALPRQAPPYSNPPNLLATEKQKRSTFQSGIGLYPPPPLNLFNACLKYDTDVHLLERIILMISRRICCCSIFLFSLYGYFGTLMDFLSCTCFPFSLHAGRQVVSSFVSTYGTELYYSILFFLL